MKHRIISSFKAYFENLKKTRFLFLYACGYLLTSIAGNLRRGVRQGCQQRGLSCIREPGGDLTEQNHQMFPFANLNLSRIQLVWFVPPLFSPHKAHVCYKLEVQSDVFSLAFTGLKRRVQRAS